MDTNRRQPKFQLWGKLKPKARQMRRAPTSAEHVLWQQLRNRQLNGYKFRRQHAFDRFIIDFYYPEKGLIIEIDGSVHESQPEEDAVCQEFLESLGLRVLRFTNEQVLKNLRSVLTRIVQALQ